MGQDYYKVLGVDRGATDEQLRAAYKNQAVKWHPDKNMNQREAAEERFKLIAEAYDVLSDPQKRAVYDRYGEDGLKGGMPQTPPAGGSSSGAAGGPSFTYSGVDADMARNLFESLFGGAGGFVFGSMPGPGRAGASGPGGARFQFMSTGPGGATFTTGLGGSSAGGGNPFNIHTSGGGNGSNRRRWASAFGGDDSEEEMFTTGAPGTNPFAAYNMGPNSFFQQQQQQQPGSGGSWGGSSAGGRFGGYGQQQQQPMPQQVALPLTLEELYSGCTKRLKVTRHVMDAASGRSLPIQEVLEIPVRPGWKEGTRVTFAGKGDETAPGAAADLVFVVKQQPHACFERKGNDLHTRVRLPLVTALTGGNASVVMPDGRSLALPISAPPVQPGATRLVVGEGMPISKGGKGDLHITFDVVFPTQLTSQQKAQLRHILPAA